MIDTGERRRSRSWARRLAAFVFFVVMPARFTAAQDSRPSPSPPSYTAVVRGIRAGTWDGSAIEALLRDLLSTNHLRAAGWWLAESEAAIAAGRLPVGSRPGLAALKCEWARRTAPSKDEKAFAQKAARHLESVLAFKNFAEARRIAGILDRYFAVFHEPESEKVRERLEPALKEHRKDVDHDRAGLEKHRKATDEVAQAVDRALHEHADQAFNEYVTAGCRTGRLEIQDDFRKSHENVADLATRMRMKELMTLARRREPTSTLRVLLRGHGVVTVIRDAEEFEWKPGTTSFDAAESTPLDFAVLPGDAIGFLVRDDDAGTPRPYEKRAYTEVAARARMGDRDLKAASWTVFEKSQVYEIKPALTELIVGEKRPWSEKRFPLESIHAESMKGSLKEVLTFETEDHLEWVPFSIWFQDIEAAFTSNGLTATWFSTRCDTPVFVVTVPE